MPAIGHSNHASKINWPRIRTECMYRNLPSARMCIFTEDQHIIHIKKYRFWFHTFFSLSRYIREL
jgi:hypothetical protein